MLGKWRHFRPAEGAEASAWAAAGNVAVLETIPSQVTNASKPPARILARDHEAFTEVAAALNLDLRWIQHTSTGAFFSVYGAKLQHALRLCRRDAAPAPTAPAQSEP